MRIAFDARPLLGPRTGVGVWLEGLLRGLVASTDWTLVLCLPRDGDDLGVADLASRTERIVPPRPLPGTLWLATVAAGLIDGRADAYVGTLAVLPRGLHAPSVLVVHDLTPRTRPADHTMANRLCFNAYFEESVAAADLVVCVSAATRDRLAQVMPAQARSARVIRHGVDPFYSPAPADAGATRQRLAGGRPFIVQLGTLEPRKGVATLVAAHGRLLERSADTPDLVLAGAPGWGGAWLDDALARHPDPSRVHRPGYVSRDDARALLRHAEAVVVASEEEGYGLPLAEALGCGAACVASDAPALQEVSAGAALTFPAGDREALAAAIVAATGPGRQQALRAAALRRAAELSWAGPLAAWRELLVGLAGSSSRRA
jgi:glycosyltransferase involved in cell wall biosynthesis